MTPVSHVEIMVEEPSAGEFLKIVVPKIAPVLSFAVYPSFGKGDLLRKLPLRLRAYKKFLPRDWRILVLLDSDGRDCLDLKNRLEGIAAEAGMATKSNPAANNRYCLANRIIVQELESWYFGDWEAVCAAYPRVPATYCRKTRFRDADAIDNTWESFAEVLRKYKYLKGENLPKILTAQHIAGHIRPERNTSGSFRQLLRTLNEFAGQ